MKKIISSKKWLITYLIILLFLTCFNVGGIALIICSAVASNTQALVIGIVTLVYMLPITGIILFYLNRRACLIWAEDGCIQRKGLLFGFRDSIKPENIDSVGITRDNKKIYVILNQGDYIHANGYLEISNNAHNMALVKSIWTGDIYSPELCDACKNIKAGPLESPEEYLDALEQIKDLIASGNYEMVVSDNPIDAVLDENGRWVDDTISHIVKCKKCGAFVHCYCDTYHGKGNLTVRK
ncbi:MAG: hypothetical protein IJ011_01540 [Clostridia bacterium]|nr:hypothetical protein [Clostridia bacterium]